MAPRLRTLVIGHDHVAGLGYFGQALDALGFDLHPVTVVPECRFTSPNVSYDYPPPADWDAVITVGAPWPRSQTESWWPSEVEFLRKAHEHGIPTIGICFGGQLLTEALGGSTEPARTERVGWYCIAPCDDCVPEGPWFQWHSDQIVPPPRSTVLATSEDGCEAFVLGHSVAIQFHPEMNSALLRDWLSVPGMNAQDEPFRDLLARTVEVDDVVLRRRVSLLARRLTDLIL